jgi:hypothetical protein
MRAVICSLPLVLAIDMLATTSSFARGITPGGFCDRNGARTPYECCMLKCGRHPTGSSVNYCQTKRCSHKIGR